MHDLATIYVTSGTSRASEAPTRTFLLPISRQVVDEERAQQAVRAVSCKEETIRSADAKLSTNLVFAANRVIARVAVAARPGPQTIPRQKRKRSSKTCSCTPVGNTWAPVRGSRAKTVENCATTAASCLGTLQRGWKGMLHRILQAAFGALRSSGIYEASRVSVYDHSPP